MVQDFRREGIGIPWRALEAVNRADEDFGEKRLAELVASLQDRPAREIVDAVHAAVTRFTEGAPPADDITVVVARRV